jgi:1-phosphofructokinase family hexose kinase
MNQKIITVTLNTAIDVTIDIPLFTQNSVIDAESCSILPAGKGINTSRVLATLGEPSLILGLIGEQSKEIYSSIESPLLQTDFVYVYGSTRQNTTIRQKSNGSLTHIRTSSFIIDENIIEKFTNKLLERLDPDDIVVFSGSLPKGVNENTYYDLLKLCKERKAFAIIDTSGKPLINAVKAEPDMIKPNLSELQSAYNLPEDVDEKSISDQMLKIVKEGISYIAVTLGSKGVLFLSNQGQVVYKGSILLDEKFIGQKPVGSGDAMLAGFIYGIKHNLKTEEIIRWGVACGAANVLPHPPGQIQYDHIQSLIKKVNINKLLLYNFC